jgi:hypothetical protein
LTFQNGVEENYYLSSLLAQYAQIFGRGSTNDKPMYVRPGIQSQAMKRKKDVVESAEVVMQPNKKRRMLREASNLSKRRSFRKLFVNIENKINLRGYINNPIYDPPRHITVRDENILKRIAPDGGNTLTRRPKKRRKMGEVSSRFWGCSLLNAADC